MNRFTMLVAALPFAVLAHPHDSPFTFIKHTMSDGHPVYTNIPQSCFKDGVMTCWEYHPVAGNRGSEHLRPADRESRILMKEPDLPVKAPSEAEVR